MSTHFPDDDPLAARLRAALTSEAAMVDPSDDGLSSIRDGVAAHRGRPWWQHPATPAAAAAVLLAGMAGGFFLLAGGDDGKDNTVATDSTPTAVASTSDSSEPSQSAASDTPTPAPANQDQVYVYYVHDDGHGPRLYREVRPAPSKGLTSPDLMTMFAPPVDPDYSTSWPAGTTVNSYQVDGDTATIDLSDFPKVGADAENVAVQELVYTVTANNNKVTKVKLLVNGKTPTSGHLDLSKPVSRAPMMDVQGLIWLLSPTEGSTVSSPVKISGYGTAFEGTISWEVLKMVKSQATDEKVAEGNTQGGSNGEFADFADTVKLPPGTYELRAFESSAEDGSAQHVDSKVFTVK